MLYPSIGIGEWKLQFRQSGFEWCLALDDLISNKLSAEYLISEIVYFCDMYRAEKPVQEI